MDLVIALDIKECLTEIAASHHFRLTKQGFFPLFPKNSEGFLQKHRKTTTFATVKADAFLIWDRT